MITLFIDKHMYLHFLMTYCLKILLKMPIKTDEQRDLETHKSKYTQIIPKLYEMFAYSACLVDRSYFCL